MYQFAAAQKTSKPKLSFIKNFKKTVRTLRFKKWSRKIVTLSQKKQMAAIDVLK